MSVRTASLSSHFIWRRVHSLAGLWLILYLLIHLIVNSQATLWLGDDGIGFVRLVNLLEALPFLQVLETVFIGIPLVVHGYWGVKRAFVAKTNSQKSDGASPSLPYERNRAFTWQRATSWILLFAIVGHVVQMRFVDKPKKISEERFSVVLHHDSGLDSLAKRIDVELEPKEEGKVVAFTKTPGKAVLLMVRETFKSLWMCSLYTVFVLAAAFHAFNGFWTSLITWGVLLSWKSQRALIPVCWIGVGLLAFLGLAAIWGSYWINLRA
jgi:succinate dehydrogenase / fumarate reductase cytochrome b subunit